MTTKSVAEPKLNLHFRLDAVAVDAAKKRARREYRTLTDVVTAAVEAYAAGRKSVTLPEPADPDA